MSEIEDDRPSIEWEVTVELKGVMTCYVWAKDEIEARYNAAYEAGHDFDTHDIICVHDAKPYEPDR